MLATPQNYGEGGGRNLRLSEPLGGMPQDTAGPADGLTTVLPGSASVRLLRREPNPANARPNAGCFGHWSHPQSQSPRPDLGSHGASGQQSLAIPAYVISAVLVAREAGGLHPEACSGVSGLVRFPQTQIG